MPAENLAPSQELQGACILVAERDHAGAEVLRRFLQSNGYRNTVSTVGCGAVTDLLYELNVDIVLIDSEVLTTLDGTDVISHIRGNHRYRHLPVLVVAGTADRTLRLRAFAQGASDILIKPVDTDELLLRLRNALLAKNDRDIAAYRDDVTGLPNREQFTKRLEWATKTAQKHNLAGAVLHIDLDRFKGVVEAFGWGTGDRLLRSVAARLDAYLRDASANANEGSSIRDVLLARLSGNEFGVLLDGINRTDSLAVIAQRLLEVIAEPQRIDGHDLTMTASIGLAMLPDDGQAVDDILSAANNALQGAKRHGGNAFRFYSAASNDQAMRRVSLAAELRRSISTDDTLSLYYQPKVRIDDGRIVGAEALLRWHHPERGFVSPAEFIPIAEESGLIEPLGNLVIDLACTQIRCWLDAGYRPPRIAINVSAIQLRSGTFADALGKKLARHGLTGRCIIIELTESVLMENVSAAVRQLHALCDMGIELSIDDFGTGYSSLSHLTSLPLHELKIDRSFLKDLQTDGHRGTLVTAILSLGHQLGLRVVAEGIETAEQLLFLKRHGCDTGQGFFFSRPVPAVEFEQLLVDGSVATSYSTLLPELQP